MAFRWETQWTKEDELFVREMYEAGASYDEIAERMSRTVHSIKAKIKRLLMSPEQLAARRAQDNACKRKAKERYESVLYVVPVVTPSPVIADRDARLSIAPRDLTAQLLGDPLPGYSALEKYTRDTVSA